ncbi:MAG: HDOD domain-containing protein [Thermodesulfovibrio sp.]|nr:HDOD domain-containing protein [Thermodesulfovibrio sp.]
METEKNEKIENIISKTLDIPSHSKIVFKVINLLKNEYVSIDEIESFMSHDKGFTARFLRIANSPFYGLTRKVKTLKDSLLLIGLNTAKSLILATSSRYLFKNFGPFEQKLYEHSLAVGLCSSLLSNYTKTIKPEEALASGILHDIGKIFINNAISESYQKIYEKIHETEKSIIQLEEEILEINHCEVGAFIAERWNYPEEIKITIQDHHGQNYPHQKENSCINICNIVRIADKISWNLGIGFKRPQKMNINLQDIGIDNKNLEEIEDLFISQYEMQKKFLLE